MKYSKEKIKQLRWLMVFAAVLVLLVIYSQSVFQGVLLLIGMLKPFIVGGIVAFIVNLPMRAIENRILGKWKGRVASKLKRPISMVLAIVFLVLLITLLFVTVVPQLGKTLAELGAKIPAFLEKLLEELKQLSAQYPQLYAEVSKLDTMEWDWKGIITNAVTFLKSGITSMLTSTIGVASSIIGGVFNGVISFIFALYILSQKEKLTNQGKRIVQAYASEKVATKVIKVFSLLNKNFASFVTGQCLEAVILGTLFVIFMTIFGMPYAVLVGVLIAFTALIPIVGAFIGCGVGAFLILIDDPIKALWFVVMFLIIQQLEGNLIYPRVVGGSVGLPSIWILVAVSLGGSLFGVAGMLFFIPLLSTAYSLLRDNVNARNAAREGAKVLEHVSDTGAEQLEVPGEVMDALVEILEDAADAETAEETESK